MNKPFQKVLGDVDFWPLPVKILLLHFLLIVVVREIYILNPSDRRNVVIVLLFEQLNGFYNLMYQLHRVHYVMHHKQGARHNVLRYETVGMAPSI